MRTKNYLLVFGVFIFALVYPAGVLGAEPVLVWKYTAGSRVYAPIELADVNGDGVVDLVGGERDNKRVFVLDGKTGNEIWGATFAGDVRPPVCIVDLNGDKILEGLVAASGDTIYCVDMRNGNQLWSLKLDGGLSLDPMIVSDLEMDGKLEISQHRIRHCRS
jgi:outer membrane protein assembly factor BamB